MIIGFSIVGNTQPKYIYTNGVASQPAKNINPYLIVAKHGNRFVFLRFRHHGCAHKRRVSHDIVLTETYISLRRLENETLSLLHRGQIMLDVGDPIQVSIGQFYGIEINDFAVTVAKTALWIAERFQTSQLLLK